MKKSRTVFIAGGGTGGHIYPAVAIARALKKEYPDLEIHFVGAYGGLEEKVIPREGYPLHLLHVGKLNRVAHIGIQIKTLLGLPTAFLKSFSLLMRYRPVVVLGVGGFASGPFLLIASLCRWFFGMRTAIWEPNVYPGLTNRWLSHFATLGFVVFAKAKTHMKMKHTVEVGLPVREEIEQLPEKTVSQSFNVLIFGGSQGAQAINQVIVKALTQSEVPEGIQIVHQTGARDYKAIHRQYEEKRTRVECYAYLDQIEQYFQWADLIFCRAGASTVAELAACKKAAVFIPLPTAADDHQRKNAEALVNEGAAKMILQKDFTPEVFFQIIEDLKNNEVEKRSMEQKVHQFFNAGAAQKIATLLMEENNEF